MARKFLSLSFIDIMYYATDPLTNDVSDPIRSLLRPQMGLLYQLTTDENEALAELAGENRRVASKTSPTVNVKSATGCPRIDAIKTRMKSNRMLQFTSCET
jgi:hypothetical protein